MYYFQQAAMMFFNPEVSFRGFCILVCKHWHTSETRKYCMGR